MLRPARQFRPWPLELEVRRLLAAGLAPPHTFIGDVGFVGQGLDQVFMQQDGPATLQLYRTSVHGVLQVQVTTDPSSPAAGVIGGPMDQTVTFDLPITRVTPP
jgi:hypothetical protein